MRSRYSAYALKLVDHLWRTLHPDHPDRSRPQDDVTRELRRTCNRNSFPRLVILSTEDPKPDGAAHVTFRASVFDRGRDVGFEERSVFREHDGAWCYVGHASAR